VLNWDRTKFADSIEEAVVNFPDLGAKKFGINHENVPINARNSAELCENDECRTCSDALLKRLRDQGAIDDDHLKNYRRRFRINGTTENGKMKCKRFLNDNIKPHKGSSKSNEHGDLKNLKRLARQTDDTSDMTFTTWTSGTVEAPDVGKRIVINCYTRGSLLNGTNVCGLCNFCWVWRQLPDNYQPQYVNELICDQDSICLSKFGSCETGMDSATVFLENGSDYEAQSIIIGQTCDCHVQSGSALQSLISD